MKAEWKHYAWEYKLQIGETVYAIVHPASRVKPNPFFIVIYPQQCHREEYSTLVAAQSAALRTVLAYSHEVVTAFETMERS